MCGIAGYYLKRSSRHPSRTIESLLSPIQSRGPDDEGVCLISTEKKEFRLYKTDKTVSSLASGRPSFKDPSSWMEHDLVLIHTRFAIIDLSDAAHQPFVTRDRSLILAFNGEIYNYLELKEELKNLGVQFKTSSDTEVLAEGYRFWGDELWPKMNGFWAVALFDLQSRQLILCRDRVGVAPLYYRETQDGLYFASCLESLIAIDPQGLSISKDVVSGFIETGFKDYDQTTYYEQIRSLPSKTIAAFGSNQFALKDAHAKVYWDFPQERLTSRDISFSEAVDQFRKIFFDAVRLRLRSDVKLAFELSGGLDSSSVVAAAAVLQKNNITTYTAKIKDADEEPYARSMLQKYKFDYHVLEGLESDFAKDYQNFSSLMEEPFDNPNAYTHYRMLLEMKNQGVHVVVTGAGGDEVLAGYEASFWPKAYQELRQVGGWSYVRADWYEFRRRFKTFARAKKTLSHYVLDSLRLLNLHSQKEKSVVRSPIFTAALKYHTHYNRLSFHEQSLFHFNIALLPYYMRSSDHFTMGIPVEHRFPMLDYRMIEFGLKLPIEYLFHNGWTKYVLRKAMEPYLPKTIVWRRQKMGFTFPYKKFFDNKRDSFVHLLSLMGDADPLMSGYGGYDELLNQDAQKLWRFLSTVIWWDRTKQRMVRS